jgi:galactokinase
VSVPLVDRLVALGLDPPAAARRADLLARALRGLGDAPPEPARLYHVPGRIEVLGKHTDYAGGRSLLAATEQGIAAAAVPRADGSASVLDTGSGERCAFPATPDTPAAPGHWSDYVRTVVRRVARDFPGAVPAFDLAVASDLPAAAGLSSSSALVVAAFLAARDAARLEAHPRHAVVGAPAALAGYLGAVENGRPFGPFEGGGGVGTLGGSQDHTAILCCASGRLLVAAFEPVRLEREVRFPPRLVFAVAASGVAAPKTGAAREPYNALARRTALLWELVRPGAPAGAATLGAALDAGAAPTLAARLEAAAPLPERAALLARLEQLRAECRELVPGMVAALEGGDDAALGTVAARSMAGAETGLANQVPETRHLVASARRLGAVAASAFGAGFGGAVWALVERGRAARFLAAWETAYRAVFPRPGGAARFLRTDPGPPAAALGPAP